MSLPESAHPAIVISVDTAADRQTWQPLLLGMEEEGIPFVLHTFASSNTNLMLLAHQACAASPLSVGVAVGTRDIVVQDPHLPVDRPLFILRDYPQRGDEELRQLGCNAARLVKGLPFKTIA
jgi:hypothetical protein